MANIVGNSGVVMIGAALVGEVKAFSYTGTSTTVEDVAMGDTVVTRKHVIKDGGGSITAHYDPADAQQLALDEGSTAAVDLRPAGTGSTLPKWTGSVIVSSKGFSQTLGEIVEISFEFVGALTEGVQA